MLRCAPCAWVLPTDALNDDTLQQGTPLGAAALPRHTHSAHAMPAASYVPRPIARTASAPPSAQLAALLREAPQKLSFMLSKTLQLPKRLQDR